MRLAAGMKALVLGLGVSGRSVVRFLHSLGLEVAVSEHRSMDRLTGEELEMVQAMGVRLETGGHSERFLAGADLVVAGPGVPRDLDLLVRARARGIPVVGELALAAGRFPVPVIGVTGSNGKTTVTGLVAELLAAAGLRVFVGGNIGTPLLDFFTGSPRADFAVLELSSFQLELAGDFRCHIGLLLNITPDHLDRHGDMEHYAAAKYRIFAGQTEDDVAIVGADDPLAMAADTGRAVRRTFGQAAGCDAAVIDRRVLVREEGGEPLSFDLAATRLDSAVNRLNAAAAILAARAAGCGAGAIRSGLRRFQPPAHRMSLVGTRDGVTWINDSKATNVGAMAAALASCETPVVLIAGGRDKGGDFSVLRPLVGRRVRTLVLIGEAAGILVRDLGDLAPVIRARDMTEAVRVAAQVARAGDTVLLAPGCASFDMFDSYEQRGRVFTRLAREMLAAGAVPDNPEAGKAGCEEG
ncbi:MAG TPA: UDP-N-acetylmuramoyl-L-alanine--D-glutamate ligase [Desulfobulbus sp.]|nr:UDP-N-acetylmuramoyl-L-alanine--D-glutamate ligase [Desulfobulbus sp.]